VGKLQADDTSVVYLIVGLWTFLNSDHSVQFLAVYFKLINFYCQIFLLVSEMCTDLLVNDVHIISLNALLCNSYHSCH
jgi:hypothetical protein